ncbi:MAG: YbhB/YbcL family Raf kinase inhibitor-like protein [Deltaproteobacteria bacterium]|nr:YbhB/YbcL family Raf kinase inhibitor-like protein [Deltaproteobacteria bacterium]
MNQHPYLYLSTFLIGTVLCFPWISEAKKTTRKEKHVKLESSAFKHNERIPSKYTCDGDNVSPPLKISAVPTAAKSLVLIMDDPDAPMGTWVHWTVWNMDPKTPEMKENSTPTNTLEGITSFGNTGYGGPCPPSGTHRYFFKLYALNTQLSLKPSDDKSKIEKAMANHILDKTELIGLYSRK